MIYIKTDDEALGREMLGGFHDRKPLSVGGGEYVLCDITRNFSPTDGASVEAKGERVTPADWNGVGLPPVGTICEIEHDTGRVLWHKVKVLYIGSEHAIVVGEQVEQHFLLRGVKFRPIRTQAQIAADEREVAIQQIMRDINRGHGVAARVYDQGYRKQPTKQDGE